MTTTTRNPRAKRLETSSARRLAVAAAVILIANAAGWLGNSSLADALPVQAAESAQSAATPTGQSPAEAAVAPVVASRQASPVGREQPAAPAAASQPPSAPAIWQGLAGQDGYVRSAPTTGAPKIGELRSGQPVRVLRWVSGQEVETENTTWADLGNGHYVYSSLLRSRPVEQPPARPVDAPSAGRWIDVDLTFQVATAYEGTTPVKSVLVSTGRPGWETPRGTFAVQRRVAKETMDGRTLLGQGPNGAGATYRLENVRWTQYFTADGSAIHENYWRNPALFGIPGSHGCIGMRPSDAAWFWDFASHGTPIVIH